MTVESLFLTCMIDAMEGRHVVTCDIPGAFMQVDMDEEIHVKLEGKIAMLLIRLDQSYQRFLTHEKGNPVIYAQLSKALYGTLQAALLFWKDLSAFLVKDMGFEPNPYDTCVVNKITEGKQCTVAWHVDDLKISHVDQRVLEGIMERLQEKYGKEVPLSVTRGHVHDYLGMTIDFSRSGKVVFSMLKYIENTILEAPEGIMKKAATTPAANHLFDTDESATKLDTTHAEIFYHLVAKLLYLCKRTRPDIMLAVAFLCTRVQQPDEDDYKKLGRCLSYLRDTKDLVLTLEASSANIIHWWVAASFAVHPDMKSHTGACMSLGKGCTINMSSKQKLNTRSSTEAELVGVKDAMALILWVRLFLRAQGFKVTDNIVYQDNQSTILLANNGKKSSGKKTRHIEIRYYFITDNIAKGNV